MNTSSNFNLNNKVSDTPSQDKLNSVKNPWPKKNDVQSKADLIQKRKNQLLPDPSFDLDGDGHVGNLDLLISKRFDLDKDGKLNQEERLKAEQALKTGYLSNFKLGLESIGPNSKLRTLQKRGVIIENDDIEKLKSTYPIIRHISVPAFSSRTQLLNTRKQFTQTSRQPDNVFRVEIEQVNPEGFTREPKFTSAQEIQTAYRNTIREKMGMTEPKDINFHSSPSLSYVAKPHFTSQSQMKEEKKKELLESLHKNADYTHITREQNLREREKYLISHNHGKTYTQVKEQTRKSINEYNQNAFSSVALGVHGQELPKFKENLKEFWRAKGDWVENPKILSHSAMTTLKGKNLLVDDKKGLDPVQEMNEPAKAVKKVKSYEITDKPNHVIPYGGYVPVENTESSYKIPNVKYRMSTVYGHFIDSAAEMGINFLPQTEQPKVEKTRTFGLETSVGPASEVPKTAHSTSKKVVSKFTAAVNPLRTTGFVFMGTPGENR